MADKHPTLGRRRLFQLAGAAAFAGATAAPATGQDPREPGEVTWQYDGFDAPRISVARSADLVLVRDDIEPGPVLALDVRTGDIEWTYEYDGEAAFSYSTVRAEFVILSDRERGVAVCLDLPSGEERWVLEPEGSIGATGLSVHLVGNIAVLAANDEGRIYALYLDTGEHAWTADVEPFDRWGVMSNSGLGYVESADKVIRTFSLTDGRVGWSFDAGDVDRHRLPVSIDGDRTFIVGNAIHVLDTETGQEVRRFDVEVDDIAYFRVTDDALYYRADGQSFLKLDRDDGTERWRLERDRRISPSLRQGTIDTFGHFYIGLTDERHDDRPGGIEAIDDETGQPVWSVETEGTVIGIQDHRDSIYFEATDYDAGRDVTYSVEHGDGTIRWTVPFDDRTGFRTYVGDRIYMSTEDGVVHTIDDRSGDVVWSRDIDGHDGRLRTHYVAGLLLIAPSYSRLSPPDDPDGSVIALAVDPGPAPDRPTPTTPTDGFAPAVHGFDFPNWADESGCSTHLADGFGCPEGETFTVPFEEVDRDAVQDAIGTWGLSLGPVTGTLLGRVIHGRMERNTASVGHCYGMSILAQEYFEGARPLPEGAAVASDIDRPDGEFAEVGEYIRDLHVTQRLNTSAYWLLLFSFEDDNIDYEAALDDLLATIDERGTATVALGSSQTDGAHMVLAHEYEERNGEVEFGFYDPNREATWYEDGEETTYVVDAETGEPIDQHGHYDYYAHLDPSLTPSAIGAITDTASDIVGRFRNTVVARLNSPAALSIDAPAEATVVHPQPEIPGDRAAADFAYVRGVDPREVTIEVIGDETAASEPYSLELFATDDGDIVLDEAHTGRISAGYADRVGFDDDEGGLAVSVDSTTTSEGLLAGRSTVELAGGVAAVAGIAYLVTRMRADRT